MRMSGAELSASNTATHTAGTPQLLLEHHLKELRLPTMLREYDKVARQCAVKQVDYQRYLLQTPKCALPHLVNRAGPHAYAIPRVDRSPRLGALDRRPARSAHTLRTYPGDECRQLPPQAEPPQTDTILRTLNSIPYKRASG
jgi:hypothetical protein